MTYTAIDALTVSPQFRGRIAACCLEQSMTYRDDQRPSWQAMAQDFILGSGLALNTFVRLAAVAPGFAAAAAGHEPTLPGPEAAEAATPAPFAIDQSRITDPEILALVQSVWGDVADTHFPPEVKT